MSPQLQDQLAQKMAELTAMMAGAGMTPPNGGPAMLPGMAPMAPMGLPVGLTPPAAPGGIPNPIGWSVAVEVPVQGQQGYGTVSIDMAFSADTWQQAPQIVQAMVMMGYKVYVRMPKPAFGGGGFGGGGGFQRPAYGGGSGFGGGGGYSGGFRRY